jgi:hypothetical protein
MNDLNVLMPFTSCTGTLEISRPISGAIYFYVLPQQALTFLVLIVRKHRTAACMGSSLYY